MKLYDMTLAPNPRRVRIFLAEKGIDVDTVQVDIFSGENMQPDFLAINPRGVLPTLQLDNGTVISETSAICRYFEEIKPEPALCGIDPVSKAKVESWISQVSNDAFGAIGDVFRNRHPGFVNRGLPGSSSTPQVPELVSRGEARMEAFLARMEAALAESEYIAGDSFTAADIAAMCALDFAEYAEIEVPSSLDNIAAWRTRVSNRPSAQA